MTERFGIEPCINFQEHTVLMNNIVQSWSHIKNFACLVTKYYVYRQRCLKKTVTFEGFKLYCDRIQHMEKYYAIKNQKLHRHFKKWKIDNFDNESLNNYIMQYADALDN